MQFLAHVAEAAFFFDFSVNKGENGVMVVEGAAPLDGDPLGVVQAQYFLQLTVDGRVLEFEFWREFFGFHGP